jgi:hypothetical protein
MDKTKKTAGTANKVSAHATPATEADFEARLSGVLHLAFPFLGPGAIRHQLRFKVRLGHKEVEIDGAAAGNVSGRLDILLTFDDRPLAVLELKRAGRALHEDDRRQALSYARLLEPMAPLAIVTNGSDMRVFEAGVKPPILGTGASGRTRDCGLPRLACGLPAGEGLRRTDW